MNVNQIVAELTSGRLDNRELEMVARALKFARSQLGNEVKRDLRPGVNVKFYHPKQGRDVTGTVDRIKQKYVLVNTAGGRYNVPANLLEVA
jgi:hypothetical protein